MNNDSFDNAMAVALGLGLIGLALASCVAIGLFKLITIKSENRSVLNMGRKWLAWSAAVVTISVLPPFFWKWDVNTFAAWIVCLVFFGTLAFLIGLAHGAVRKDKSASPPVPVQETHHEEISKQYYCFIDGVVKGPFGSDTLAEMLRGGIITNDTQCCEVGRENWTPLSVALCLVRKAVD